MTVYPTVQEVYDRTGLSSDDVGTDIIDSFLTTADAMVDKITGRDWNTAAATATEFIDGFDFFEEDHFDDPVFRTSRNNRQFEHIQLARGNISTLTSLEFLNLDGTTATTVQATDVVTNNSFFKAGLLKLESNTVPSGFGNIKVVYTYGVDSGDKDITLVKELQAYYAGIQALVSVSGGTFDDVTAFTLGNRSVSLGEPYINIREAINQAQARIDQILSLLGGRVDMVIV